MNDQEEISPGEKSSASLRRHDSLGQQPRGAPAESSGRHQPMQIEPNSTPAPLHMGGPPALNVASASSSSAAPAGGRRGGGGSGRRSPSGVGVGPRLLSRDLPFKQSSNKLNVRNSGTKRVAGLMRADWFHVFLRHGTWKSITTIIVVWTIMIIVFSFMYMLADAVQPDVDCGLTESNQEGGYGDLAFSSAFAFSLETATTVGYGLPGSSNAFFEGCPELQIVIYMQMLYSLLFNAFLFAFFFARLSRSENRGFQVIFGDKAVIRRGDDGRWTMSVRIYDCDPRHPLVEAHVRFYAVQHDAWGNDVSFDR